MNIKDALYFSHDSNARNDMKMLRLRRQLGMEGIGIYWCLIEMLREAPEYKLELAFIEDISHSIDTAKEKTEAVIKGYSLFQIDELYFFSQRLMRTMEHMQSFKQIKSDAGKKGMMKRWNKRPPKLPNI